MSRIEVAFSEIDSLDLLAAGESFVHRLDPRAKLITTLVFVLCVVSSDKYQFVSLLPYFVFPLALLTITRVPVGFLLKKLLFLAPFAVLVGIFNPLFDRQILTHIGPLAVSGGWLSFASILLRFILTVSAALLLIASTSFSGVCLALERLGAPQVFTNQLLFLHRYLFVLVEEGARMVRARAMRSHGSRGREMAVVGQMLGQLLLRTFDRAERIHRAMRCRGFTGEIRLLRHFRFGAAELLFTCGWSGMFVLLRIYDAPLLLGGGWLELAR